LEADASRHARADAFEAGIEHAREAALNEAESTAALWEQGRQARARARMLREESQRHPQVRGQRDEQTLDHAPRSGADWTKGRGQREREQMKRDESGRAGDRLR
jgi:hypothetical protein